MGWGSPPMASVKKIVYGRHQRLLKIGRKGLMDVVCNTTMLSVLRRAAATALECSQKERQSLRIIQRVSELMAAATLADLDRHEAVNLQVISPPPKPLFTMDLLDSARLIFAPSCAVSVNEHGQMSWECITSVELISIQG